MRGKKIEELVRDDCYQLFVMDSPLPFPLCLIRHSYIVVNDHGRLTRWDVLHKKYPGKNHRGYVHKDLFSPWCGLGLVYFPRVITGHFWHFQARLVGLVEGKKDSQVGKQIACVGSVIKDYPHWDGYLAFPGPNSNTFVRWVLDQIACGNISLSRSAVGKSYEVRKS